MTLEEAAEYWRLRLVEEKPINRVRVRRLLALAGAERRGWAIMRRIAEALDDQGLETNPDFRSAWIDGLVSIRLKGDPNTEDASGAHVPPPDSDIPTEDQEIDPFSEDPCPDVEIANEDGAVPLANNLSSPDGNQGVIEIPVAAPIDPPPSVLAPGDPVRRISSIASANRGVVSVLLTDPLKVATTLMRFEGYSQLAIMQSEREVRGVISWESIAKRSMLKPEPTLVSDCRVDAQVIDADGSLFEALPTIEKFDYVLVRSKEKKITGIVTASDLAVELRSLSYPFMSIGTIEGLIRRKLHPHITVTDLALLEEHSKARIDSDVSAMTFGENVRLLERDDIWIRLNVDIDKKQFTKRLLIIRDIRNDVMHFNPDPLGPNQKRELDQMEDFLREVFS
jgi:CBS domain-containing protein